MDNQQPPNSNKKTLKQRLRNLVFPISALQIILYAFSLGLLSLSIFYWARMIMHDLWDELGYRIIIMVLAIGALVVFTLARILHNQAKILGKLKSETVLSKDE